MSTRQASERWLLTDPRPLELALYAVLVVAWLASTTELREALRVSYGVPLTVTGSLPSFLAALATTFLIGGAQGANAAYAGLLSALVMASAELPPMLGVTNGVADPVDVAGAGLGGIAGALSLAVLRAATGRGARRG